MLSDPYFTTEKRAKRIIDYPLSGAFKLKKKTLLMHIRTDKLIRYIIEK